MRKTILLCFCLMFVLTAGSFRLFGQENPGKTEAAPPHYYHLLFTLEEIGENGKVANSRTYTTSVAERSYEQIRTGSRVPIKSNDRGEIQYIDIGVNIDCKDVHEISGKFSAVINADISSVASQVETPNLMPIVRQNRWSANVLVPLGKPTVIFSSDDLQSKGKMQITLTATSID